MLCRLFQTRGYLCGPMDKVADCGIDWRRKLIERLYFMGINWLDPTNKPCTRALEGEAEVALGHELLSERRYDEAAKMFREVRHIDLRLVDICDFVVARIDLSVPMCGTWEEIFWANRMQKPVIAVIVQGKANAPGWLFGTLPHHMIFSTMLQAEAYLKHISYEQEIDLADRWAFFDFKEAA